MSRISSRNGGRADVRVRKWVFCLPPIPIVLGIYKWTLAGQSFSAQEFGFCLGLFLFWECFFLSYRLQVRDGMVIFRGFPFRHRCIPISKVRYVGFRTMKDPCFPWWERYYFVIQEKRRRTLGKEDIFFEPGPMSEIRLQEVCDLIQNLMDQAGIKGVDSVKRGELRGRKRGQIP